MTFATFEIFGRQYRATEGDILLVEAPNAEKFSDKKGEKLFSDPILIEDQNSVFVGSDAKKYKISLEVVGFFRSKKINTKKFKQRKRYRKFITTRRSFVKFKVSKIAKS